MEIQKFFITINYIENYFLKEKNFIKMKAFLDLITYWFLSKKISKDKIKEELKKFHYPKNKDRRLVLEYYNNLLDFKLRPFIKSISKKDERWSIKYSIPLIIYQQMNLYYSNDELESLGKYFISVSQKYVWINQLRGDVNQIKEEILKSTPISEIKSVKNAFSLGKGKPIQHLGAFNQGKIIIQDIGAILITQLLPEVTEGNIIDLCASPGNKTIQLIQRYIGKSSIKFYASDLPGSRFSLLGKRLQFLLGYKNQLEVEEDKILNLNLNKKENREIHLYPRDVTDLNSDFDDGFFKLVFIDAPCSGSGTFGTKPDTRNQVTEEFILKHVSIQEKILTEANRILSKGGYIFYVTCSILINENEEQVKKFLDKFPNYILLPLKHELATSSSIIPESIRLFPPKSKSEGFFACLLQKK